MKIVLDTENVFTYLNDRNYCDPKERDLSKVRTISAKNFNIAIEFNDGRSLLVKQEIPDEDGETLGEFAAAWQIHQAIDRFPQLGERIKNCLPELLAFDPENSILVGKFATDCQDLARYYHQERIFPTQIAREIGSLLATIHSHTFERMEFARFLRECSSDPARSIVRRLARITPRVFMQMPIDCLQFFKLYQRAPGLVETIVELGDSIDPCCLTHNDLKLNNILLNFDWENPESLPIRLIDWERANWGDPAFDLGCILGSYLEIWLDGLIITSDLSINECLQLAETPLELLQPSLFSLTRAYLDGFPQIAIDRPDFLDRVIRFAGLALIQRVEITIEEVRIFGNRGIIMLQVAKQLLCSPQAAMSTLFGKQSELLMSKPKTSNNVS